MNQDFLLSQTTQGTEVEQPLRVLITQDDSGFIVSANLQRWQDNAWVDGLALGVTLDYGTPQVIIPGGMSVCIQKANQITSVASASSVLDPFSPVRTSYLTKHTRNGVIELLWRWREGDEKEQQETYECLKDIDTQ